MNKNVTTRFNILSCALNFKEKNVLTICQVICYFPKNVLKWGTVRTVEQLKWSGFYDVYILKLSYQKCSLVSKKLGNETQ